MATGGEKAAAAPAKAKGGPGMMVMIVVAVLAVGAGFAMPRLFLAGGAAKPPAEKETKKPAIVPFGEVVVNLGGADEEKTPTRLTRYLRVKIILVVDGKEEKVTADHIQKQKAYLKSWLISFLSDQSVQDVSRATGVNRVRREIRDQFNAILFPDGAEKVLDVLFDEFQVQ
jgi:flagellar basal body-associated protein FliL